MSDVVKLVFDADLDPLDQKVEEARSRVDTLVAETEAKMKGIKGPGDPVGGVGDVLDKAKGLKETSALAATKATAAETAANVGLAASSEAAAVAGTTQAAANTGVAASAGAATVALEAEAVAATEVTAALAATELAALGVVAVVGSVIAVGASAVLVSTKLKEEAEARLASEERIASAINKQVLGLKEALSDYQKIKDELVKTEALQRNIAGLIGQGDIPGVRALREKTDQENLARVAEINRLQAQLRTNENSLAFEQNRAAGRGAISSLIYGGSQTESQKRQNIGMAEQEVERTKKQLAEAEDSLKKGITTLQTLDKAQGEIVSNQNKRFASGFESFSRSTDDARRFAEQQAAKFADSVKAGLEKVKQLSAGYKNEFEQLFLNANRDNPFATQVIQSVKALDSLEQRLKGVGPELRKQALELQAAAEAQQTYNLQINSAFQAVDLRARADRFRNPTQRELQQNFSDREEERQRVSNSTNPDVLYQRIVEAFKIGAINREEAMREFRANAPGLNPDVYRQFNETIKNSFTDEQRKTQRTVDEKLDIAGRAKTEDQKATADAAVIAFAGGLNPDDLTKSERAKIADALERSAARTEVRQQRALKIQEDLLTTLGRIDKRGETLSKSAREGGKEGLDATIKIVDETEGGVGKEIRPKRPTQRDVSETYGLAGGPGGLSSF